MVFGFKHQVINIYYQIDEQKVFLKSDEWIDYFKNLFYSAVNAKY